MASHRSAKWRSVTEVRQRQRWRTRWGPRGTGRPLTGAGEGRRGPAVRPQTLSQHLPPARHCPSCWQPRKRRHRQTVLFHTGDALNGNRKQSQIRIHQDFRLQGWKGEAIFIKWGTPREVAGKSFSEMVALGSHTWMGSSRKSILDRTSFQKPRQTRHFWGLERQPCG